MRPPSRRARSYADIRINRYRNQFIFTRDRRVQNIVNTEDYGFGVRVIVDGTWGFASSSAVTKDEIARVARAGRRHRAGQQGASTPSRSSLAPVEPYHDVEWNTPVKKNPFEMPLQPKLDLLLQINEEALKVHGRQLRVGVHAVREREEVLRVDRGLPHQQSLVRSYPTFSVTAVDRETATVLLSATSLTAPMGMGYEYVESLPLARGSAASPPKKPWRCTRRSRSPAGQKTLILHPSNLWLTIHESVGHPTELDRALGYEANFAGTSFLTTDKLGKFEFGSPAREHRRRQDAGARHGDLRLRRRRREDDAASRSSRTACSSTTRRRATRRT